jgi:hypothetical protein
MSRRLTLLILLLVLPVTAFTQTKGKKTVKKPPVKKSVAKKPAAVTSASTTTGNTTAPAVAPSAEPTPPKKNERPEDTTLPQGELKKANKQTDGKAAAKPAYPFFYEFTQPTFYIDKVTIAHDDSGKGTITFSRRDFDESYTDPVQLSAVTMQKLKTWWDNLNFLDSTEKYQAARDFSHLGTTRLKLKRDTRERLVEFNWTENKDAKALMDEYRNLGQQYIWMFDMTLARENQPLEAPKLMDSLESMLKRGEISDPQQMTPLLNDLGSDERIPLLARNHALKLVKQIEKDKK